MSNQPNRHLAIAPDITVYMNCDTILAIKASRLKDKEEDELVFTIKNYDYIESPYIFMFRAKNTDINENGEILFKIPPECAQQLKPGSFYNISKLSGAFDLRRQTDYIKLTTNGKIFLEYGAQAFTLPKTDLGGYEILSARLEEVENISDITFDAIYGEILGVQLQPLAQEEAII